LRTAAGAAIVSGVIRDRTPFSFEHFLDLTAREVEEEAIVTRANPDVARTWTSLANVLRREGYGAVRDLGLPAANAWGTHLGVAGAARRF
jgi:hypothetical protein